MCLAVLAWYPEDQTPLKIVANRDEFRKRPATPMHWWDDHPILAGKDLEAGGTWLGFNKSKKFALLTNIRPGFVGVKGNLSRGELVTDFLKNGESIESYHQKVVAKIDQYAGFNLILFDGRELFWFNSLKPEGISLEPGVHAVSNDSLNTPWPKTTLAIQQMESENLRLSHELTAHRILSSQQLAEDDKLPNTGVPLDWERRLSAQTILGSEYGTRCRTHVSISENDRIDVAEQQVNASGEVTDTVQFHF